MHHGGETTDPGLFYLALVFLPRTTTASTLTANPTFMAVMGSPNKKYAQHNAPMRGWQRLHGE
jgi:hypothetical protein